MLNVDTIPDEDEGEASGDVKSNAVIKFETVKTPAKFIELQRNTNLKEAPSNWLQGGSKWEHLLREASLGKDHSFSSINMAHSFPDLTGSIDVISDANVSYFMRTNSVERCIFEAIISKCIC